MADQPHDAEARLKEEIRALRAKSERLMNELAAARKEGEERRARAAIAAAAESRAAAAATREEGQR